MWWFTLHKWHLLLYEWLATPLLQMPHVVMIQRQQGTSYTHRIASDILSSTHTFAFSNVHWKHMKCTGSYTGSVFYVNYKCAGEKIGCITELKLVDIQPKSGTEFDILWDVTKESWVHDKFVVRDIDKIISGPISAPHQVIIGSSNGLRLNGSSATTWTTAGLLPIQYSDMHITKIVHTHVYKLVNTDLEMYLT